MTEPQAKRLCILVPSLHGGGAEHIMVKLAGGLVRLGYSVDLVLCQAKGPYLAEVPDAVRVIDLHSARVLASLPALARYLRRERPAALLSVLHANLVALWAKRVAGVSTRVVVSERNTLSRVSAHYRADLRMRWAPALARLFYPWADGVVAVSRGVADDLAEAARIPRRHIKVIYNPVVTPELRSKAQASLRHPWFELGEPPVILAIGRLTAQKGLDVLIQAFSRVRAARRARLLILGEGEERPALEAMVRQFGLGDDVSLPGFEPNPYPYMARAALFVLSSRWEGLPGVLIEALFCGAPVISTDCPYGPREILADGRYGVLVPVGDVHALAEAMEAALDGERRPSPTESWMPFESESVVRQYLVAMLGGQACSGSRPFVAASTDG